MSQQHPSNLAATPYTPLCLRKPVAAIISDQRVLVCPHVDGCGCRLRDGHDTENRGVAA